MEDKLLKTIEIERNNKNGKSKPIQYYINENGCHVCVSHKSESVDGYIQVGHNNKTYKLHRLLYQLFVGEIPAGKIIMHKCDNRHCANIDHYELGTIKKNNEDMYARNRRTKKRVYLTLSQKIELYENIDNLTAKLLCEKYNIGYSTVKDIRKAFREGRLSTNVSV